VLADAAKQQAASDTAAVSAAPVALTQEKQQQEQKQEQEQGQGQQEEQQGETQSMSGVLHPFDVIKVTCYSCYCVGVRFEQFAGRMSCLQHFFCFCTYRLIGCVSSKHTSVDCCKLLNGTSSSLTWA
jgi:hypothetical protein